MAAKEGSNLAWGRVALGVITELAYVSAIVLIGAALAWLAGRGAP